MQMYANIKKKKHFCKNEKEKERYSKQKFNKRCKRESDETKRESYFRHVLIRVNLYEALFN